MSAVNHPPPVRIGVEQQAGRHGECAGEVGGHRIDRDHHVALRDEGPQVVQDGGSIARCGGWNGST